jgi:hypothetical protein
MTKNLRPLRSLPTSDSKGAATPSPCPCFAEVRKKTRRRSWYAKTLSGRARRGAGVICLRIYATMAHQPPSAEFGDPKMNEDTLNLSIRKFLKAVGINSQREIEHAVAKAVAAHSIAGTESFPATMTLEVAGLKIKVQFSGDIVLQ